MSVDFKDVINLFVIFFNLKSIIFHDNINIIFSSIIMIQIKCKFYLNQDIYYVKHVF